MSSQALQLKNKGNEQFQKKQFNKAIEFYTKAIALNGKDKSFYGNRAACYIALKKYKEGLNDSKKAVEIDRNFQKAYYRIIQCHIGLGNTYEAKLVVNKAKKIFLGSIVFERESQRIDKLHDTIEKGKSLLNSESYASALKEFEKAEKISPQSVKFSLLKAEALLASDINQAISISTKVLRNERDCHSDCYYIRGKGLYFKGQTKQGLKHLVDCLELDPGHQNCRKFRKRAKKAENLKKQGNAHFGKGEYKEAMTKYLEAIEILPLNKSGNAKIHCNRAAAADKLKDYDLAVTCSTKAILLDPNYIKAYQRRSSSYVYLDDYEKALRDLEKAQELDPENRDIAKNIKIVQKALKGSKRKDYYKILGIEKNATQQEITKAYKKAAKKHHPDRFLDPVEKDKASERFKDIGEAHDLLKDPKKRDRYDNGADLHEASQPGMGGIDLSNIFQMFGGGGGHRHGGFGGGGHQSRNSGFSFNFGGGGGDPFGF